jgi:predicted dehydrogenase
MEPAAPPTRLGLVGLNERAERLLLRGLAASPRAVVAAVCSRDLAKARHTAAWLSARGRTTVRAFDRFEEMAGSGTVDAVFINTPVAQHYRLCLVALDAGCDVICEKPLAETAAQALELAHRAAACGARTVVNFTYRSVAGYRATERLLRASPLGRPCHAAFALLQGHSFFPEAPLRSALLDSGVHLFDTLLSLTAAAGFGHLTEVCALAMRDPGEAGLASGVDHGWAFLGQTASGAAVSASFSRRALGWRNGWRWALSGDAAAIEVELDADRTAVWLSVSGDERPQGIRRLIPLAADLQADYARFPEYHMDRLVAAVRGEAPFPGFAEAVATHLLAEALAESATSRRWVPVPALGLPAP